MNKILLVVEEAPDGGPATRALDESIFAEAEDIGDCIDKRSMRFHSSEGMARQIDILC